MEVLPKPIKPENPIRESATKLTLLGLAGALCFIVVSVVMVNAKQEAVIANVLDIFKTAVVSVMSFYFGQKIKNN